MNTYESPRREGPERAGALVIILARSERPWLMALAAIAAIHIGVVTYRYGTGWAYCALDADLVSVCVGFWIGQSGFSGKAKR